MTDMTAASADSLAPTSSSPLKVRPMGGNQPRTHWQSDKRQRTLSLTEEAWSLAGVLAAESSSNRSEVLEILLRHAAKTGMDLTEIRGTLLN